MDISVIVVTYNQESTIGRTLDSILSQQTEAEYEIIVGDDCSTDGTEAICRRYAEKYPDKILYFRRSANMGVVGNYFDCIAQARGRYLADCAGDDYWVDPRKLQKQFEVLESNPDVTLVATRWLCEDSSCGALYSDPKACSPGEYIGHNLILPVLLNQSVIHLCTALYRKSVIDDILRKNPEVMVSPDFPCEDRQIILAALQAGKILILPDLTLHYSVGHNSISNPGSFAKHYRYFIREYKMSRTMERYFLPQTSPKEKRHLQYFHKKKGDYILAMAYKGRKQLDKKELFEIPLIDCGIKGKIYRLLL